MADTKIVITAETHQAESALVRLDRKVEGVSKGFLSFAGIAGALSVGAFGAFVKKSIDAADELAVLSEKTGTTVEALAGLKFAAEQNDTSLQSVALSAKKLSSSLAENPALFKQYGITATDTTGAMLQLSDIFQTMPDGVEKSALAVKLMGKSGEEMIPLLNQGSEALAGFITEGQKIYPVSTQSAAAARQFNDDFAKMQAQISGVGMAIGAELVPAIGWIVENGIKPFIGGIKILGVELAYFVQRTMAGIERLTSPSTWGKEGTEQYRRYLKTLRDIAEEEKIGIAASMSGIGAAAAPSATPKATGSGRKLLKALSGGDAEDKAADKADLRRREKEAADFYKQNTKIAAEIEREQAKYDKLHEIALQYTATDTERVTWKLAFDFDQMDKERAAAIEHGAWNADLETSYNQARIEREAMAAADIAKINKDALEKKQQSDALEIQFMRASFAFKKSMRISDLGNSLDLLAQATSGMALHNRKAFEINKVATIANIAVKAPGIIVDAYKSGLKETGSMWGGAAYAAAAGVAVYAQLSAAQGATYGGGGSVAPSSGGTAGVSASSAASQAGTQPQASTTTAAPAAQPITINLYNTGTFVDAQAFVNGTIIPQIQDQIANADVLLIDPRSRQAQLLAGT